MTCDSGWDQFATNEKKFGIHARYDESRWAYIPLKAFENIKCFDLQEGFRFDFVDSDTQLLLTNHHLIIKVN